MFSRAVLMHNDSASWDIYEPLSDRYVNRVALSPKVLDLLGLYSGLFVMCFSHCLPDHVPVQ